MTLVSHLPTARAPLKLSTEINWENSRENGMIQTSETKNSYTIQSYLNNRCICGGLLMEMTNGPNASAAGIGLCDWDGRLTRTTRRGGKNRVP